MISQNRIYDIKNADFIVKRRLIETRHAANGDSSSNETNVCIHDDPGLTLTYFTAWSIWSPMPLNRENYY